MVCLNSFMNNLGQGSLTFSVGSFKGNGFACYEDAVQMACWENAWNKFKLGANLKDTVPDRLK
jgi:DNA relaxase NicK